MAGRGTDIKLGPGVVEAGGLAIIGTERHEARRIDRQLRGRAGRQGDPGSTQFYVSLEDNLMRIFGSDRISRYMDRLGLKEGEIIQHSLITKSIERAQKKVEENNFGIRKRLLEYDDVMNNQREVVYTRRRNALFGDKLEIDINNMLSDFSEDLVISNKESGDYEEFLMDLVRYVVMQTSITNTDFNTEKNEVLIERLFVELQELYKHKTESIATKAFPVIRNVYNDKGQVFKYIVVPFTTDNRTPIQIMVDLEKAYKTKGLEIPKSYERIICLNIIDDAWKEHLRELDDLKQSVQNAVYEQKDPILIYKLESFKLFEQMLGKINRIALPMILKGDILSQDAETIEEGRQPGRKTDLSNLETSRKGDFYEKSPQAQAISTSEDSKMPVRVDKEPGRNDPCPCGSGKKYKNCHGAV
jgi:preprotein translocase subunit SecA